jgi:predicted restriction endonuclease
LKNLYQGKCQLCGTTALPAINADICEIHHIDYFSSSHNNDATNLIVLCPNHHRIIHKLNPVFNLKEKEFVFENGKRIKIVLDYHLGGE